MKLWLKLMTLGTLCGILLSCASLRVAEVPFHEDLISAANYITELKENDELPGIRREDRRVGFSSIPIKASDENSTKPLELTMKATVGRKKGQTFWYRLSRRSPDASWQLVEAWQTDREGNRVNFDTKSAGRPNDI